MNKSLIMGVINITPDSFSDGGHFIKLNDAMRQAHLLADAGADILDLGAESTRPGAKPLAEDEEWRRLQPLLKELSKENIPVQLSIDTYKPGLMLRAADLGVGCINNIMGLSDSQTLNQLSRYPNLNYIAMHIHGVPESMQQNPLAAKAAVDSVGAFFKGAKSTLQAAGFKSEHIWLDPGIGFGKNDAANLQLLQYCLVHAKEASLVVGVSRKGFIGRLLDIEQPEQRDNPAKLLEFALMASGIGIIRTHEVKKLAKMRQLLMQS